MSPWSRILQPLPFAQAASWDGEGEFEDPIFGLYFIQIQMQMMTTLTVLLSPPEPMGMCQRLVSASKETSFYVIPEDRDQDLGTIIPLP